MVKLGQLGLPSVHSKPGESAFG